MVVLHVGPTMGAIAGLCAVGVAHRQVAIVLGPMVEQLVGLMMGAIAGQFVVAMRPQLHLQLHRCLQAQLGSGAPQHRISQLLMALPS